MTAAPQDEETPPEEGATILVVDDDEANLLALRAVLAELGHPVVCARSGEEALRRLLKHDFAVILLDVRMPGMDGYETATLIRSRPRSRDVPIIFLSGVDKDPSHLFRGYATGAVDFVFKPVEPIILRSKVAVFTDLYEKARAIRRQAEHERRLLAENLEVRARQMEVAEALERSLMQQSLVIDTLPVALFVSRRTDGYASREFVGGDTGRLLRLDDAALAEASRAWLERVHADDRARFSAALEQGRETGEIEIEYRFRAGDDSYVWLFERASLRRPEGGGDPELFGLLSDVSDRRRLEEQLTHAQKIEAVGQMSGAIAHDFNNMLSVIIGSLDRVLATAEIDTKTRRRLSLAMQAAESCADLTKRLLGFARRQALEPRELRLGDEIERLKGLFERVLGETIEAKVALRGELWPVRLDPSQFEAALVNLVVNARDAMPDGGTLTLSAENVALGEGDAATLDMPPGDYVRLSLADTGVGMDEATQARALEPFFTTKEPGKGTGLGLSTIYGFVRQSDGGLRIESAKGRGTTVHLYLPRSTATTPVEARTDKSAAQRDLKGLRVLLVEDNDKVRDVVVSMLASLGCEIVVAPNADAAIALEEKQPPDVLFTDCVMAGELDGPRLAARMRERHPELAILFTSGYRGAADALPTDRAGFLPKPFTLDQLATSLSTLLPAPEASPSPAATARAEVPAET